MSVVKMALRITHIHEDRNAILKISNKLCEKWEGENHLNQIEKVGNIVLPHDFMTLPVKSLEISISPLDICC